MILEHQQETVHLAPVPCLFLLDLKKILTALFFVSIEGPVCPLNLKPSKLILEEASDWSYVSLVLPALILRKSPAPRLN